MKQSNSEFERKCEAYADEIKRLNEQRSELCRRVEGGEGAKAALEALQQENEHLKEVVRQSGEKQTELLNQAEQKVEGLKVENSELESKMHGLENEINSTKAEKDSLQEQISELGRNIQQLQADLLQVTKLRDQFEQEKSVVKESLTATKDQLNKTTTALKEKVVGLL